MDGVGVFDFGRTPGIVKPRYEEGETGDSMFFLIKGCVEVVLDEHKYAEGESEREMGNSVARVGGLCIDNGEKGVHRQRKAMK